MILFLIFPLVVFMSVVVNLTGFLKPDHLFSALIANLRESQWFGDDVKEDEISNLKSL